MHCWCGHPSSSSDSPYPSSVPHLILSLGFKGEAAQDRTSAPNRSVSKALEHEATLQCIFLGQQIHHTHFLKRHVTVNASSAIQSGFRQESNSSVQEVTCGVCQVDLWANNMIMNPSTKIPKTYLKGCPIIWLFRADPE